MGHPMSRIEHDEFGVELSHLDVEPATRQRGGEYRRLGVGSERGHGPIVATVAPPVSKIRRVAAGVTIVRAFPMLEPEEVHHMRRVMAAISLVLVLFGLAAAGHAHAYPPEEFGLTGDRTIYAPGSTGTFTMTGCAPGELVTFQMYRNPPVGDPVTIAADSNGTAVATNFPIPDEPGDYYMIATGDQGCTDRYDFKVAALSATGSDSMAALLAGAALVATGLALFLVTRSRRRPRSTPTITTGV